MATNIVLKRSSSSGAVPSTSDLALGEIAINTYDGKMFTKKTVSGTSSIVELTGSIALSSSAFDLINYKFVATSNQTSFSGNDANSVSLAYASGTIQVFLNGILLDPTDYTATNGTAVVLDTGANSGDILYISRFAGVNPFDDFKYVADANQTTFTGSDANSETLLYTVGNLAVYLNGVLLDATDFTATNGSSVVLASGASAGDILHIHEFNQTGLTEVHADTTPTLGGDLDMHTFDLVTTDNRNIDIIPHGTGNVNLTTDTVLIGTSGENVVVTSNGTGDMTVSTNSGTNSGTLKILDGANQNIEITPNGSGKINLDGLLWPNADGSANQYLQTDGSGNLSFVDVLDTSEEIQDTVGAMFSSNTETGITATYQDSDGTIDLALVSRNIHGVAFDGSADIDLTEVVQDTVGAMVSSNTETNITVTYQDGDGTIDLVVPNTLSNVTELGTLTHLDVDNLNLNGNTLTSASSDFIIDASHDIILDADGGDILLKDAGTTFGEFTNSSTDFIIKSTTSDKDIIFKGNDGGSAITALTLDMSNAGAATFNHDITTNKTLNVGGGTAAGDNASVGYDSAEGLILTGQGSNTDVVIKNDANQSVLNIPTGTRNVVITAGSLSAASLDISGDVDIDGTLEADAITVNGTTLAETISDTVGAMVTSNTESGITVAYQDADNTLDFTIGTLNQNTTGTAATVTTAAQPNITSLGTLTTLTVDDITINGSTISDGADLTLDVEGNIVLDANGGGVYFKDAGTTIGFFQNDGGDFRMISSTSDKDIKFMGNDGGSTITALSLDMSDGGNATFNKDIFLSDNSALRLGQAKILGFIMMVLIHLLLMILVLYN